MALLEALRARVESAAFKQTYRQREKDFTRERLLAFTVMVVSPLKRMSRSLSVAVSSVWGWWADCSKQAYSRQRQKLQHEAFMAARRPL